MNERVLLTGGSGLLGTELQKYIRCEAPPRVILDIKDKIDPEKNGFSPDIVIHSAAYTDVTQAEEDKVDCFATNVLGTKHLLDAFPNSYFVYISSEYVYNPINFYAYTKLWGEELVSQHPNHLIIRTLFKSKPFPYSAAFFDQYTTGDYVDIIAPMIVKEIYKKTNGIIDLGTGRKTLFDLARQTKPDIRGISVDDIKDVRLPKDYLIDLD